VVGLSEVRLGVVRRDLIRCGGQGYGSVGLAKARFGSLGYAASRQGGAC
jgi:hypothetical protein